MRALTFAEEAAARENVLKSAYENRISRLEKEKTEMQAERDRSLREVEVSAQRINTLQRQLHSQPVSSHWFCFWYNRLKSQIYTFVLDVALPNSFVINWYVTTKKAK